VSGYGLDDRAAEVQSPEEAKDFPLAFVSRKALRPTQPRTVGTGGPFLGSKMRPRRDADHSHPSSAVVKNE
jgi:hypothetical protein